MGTGVSGNAVARLAEFQRRIGKMVGTGPAVAQRAAPRLLGLTQAGFDSQSDPYGAAWRPAKRNYGHPLLQRTGALRGGITVSPEGSKVRVTLGVTYARYHITTGRGILPQRGKLPEGWKVVCRDETYRVMGAIAEGRAAA
jgi:phage gpG-like protein